MDKNIEPSPLSVIFLFYSLQFTLMSRPFRLLATVCLVDLRIASENLVFSLWNSTLYRVKCSKHVFDLLISGLLRRGFVLSRC